MPFSQGDLRDIIARFNQAINESTLEEEALHDKVAKM